MSEHEIATVPNASEGMETPLPLKTTSEPTEPQTVLKIRVSRTDAVNAIAACRGALAPKSPMPVLGNILITATADSDGKKGARFTGTDLNNGVVVEIGAHVEVHGGTTIPGTLLYDMVKNLPGDTITIEANDRGHSRITAGRYKTEINGIDADAYPSMPHEEGGFVEFPPGIIPKMTNIAGCVAQNQTRPALSGVHFVTTQDGRIRITGANGEHMQLTTIEANSEIGHIDMVVQDTTIRRLSIFNPDEPFRMFVSQKQHPIFVQESMKVVGIQIGEKYPDFSPHIPTRYSGRCIVYRQELIRNLQLAQPHTWNNSVAIVIEETGNGGIMHVRAKNPATGEFDNGGMAVVADIKREGRVSKSKVNIIYLLHALRSASTEQVAIELQEPKNPFVLKEVDGDPNFVAVIMPMGSGE